MTAEALRAVGWDSPTISSSRAPAVQVMCSWLDAHMEGNAYMRPVRDLMALALDGHPIDVSRTDWAAMIPEHIVADGDLAGCLSRHYSQWREIAPDRLDLWRMLRNGWSDPKLDPDYPYAATSAAIPARSTGQQAIELQYPAMLRMGVIGRVVDPPEVPLQSDRHHILRNAPQEKRDEHGTVLDEVRVVTATRVESANEDTPRYQGFSPDDYCRWIKPGHVSLKGDLSKMFWQVRAKQSQSDRMMFYWQDQLYQWKVMVMGMSGSGYWATTVTNITRSFLRAKFLIDVFTYVDEWIGQDELTLMTYLNQAFTVVVIVWLGGRPNIGKTQLAFTLERTPTVALFIGIMSDSMRNRVSPAPARIEVIRIQAARLLLASRGGGLPIMWSEVRQLKARIISCARIHMLAGFLTVRMATVHRQFLKQHGSTKRAHRQFVPIETLYYARRELAYWAETPANEAWRPAACPLASGTVAVDASTHRMAMHGRSANLQSFFFSAPMSPEERVTSHNSMEMLSITRGIPGLIRDGYMPAGRPTAPSVLTALADNVTTVQALNRLTTTSLFIAEQMIPFVRWQASNHCWTTGYYHPKILMDSQKAIMGLGAGMTTDEASRTFGGLWSRAIPSASFDRICQYFGVPQSRVIDMMACCQSKRVPRFVSRLPDIQNLWTDALNPLHPWDHELNEHMSEDDVLYCFPPPKMLERVLDRMEHTSNYVLLVVRYDSRLPIRLLQSQRGFRPLTFGMEIADMIAPEGPAAPTLTGERMTLLASLFCPPFSSPPGESLRPSGQLSVPGGRQGPVLQSQGSSLNPVSRHGQIGSQAKGMVSSTSHGRR